VADGEGEGEEVSPGWFLFSIALLFVAAIAAGISTGKISTGVAVFVFGFALVICADEIAGGDGNRQVKK
jgi:tellurite resistance protein TehA-like permease